MENIEYLKVIDFARSHLRSKGVKFDAGLSDKEFEEIERKLAFQFPPDFHWFLASAVPIGEPFPPWRGADEALHEIFEWPFDGICFDIRNASYWRNEWGPRPLDDDMAQQQARRWLEHVPRLVPIASHCYLPCSPKLARNPVFSVYQTDIIHRGANLADYLFWLYHNEDQVNEIDYPVFDESYRQIEFWTQMARENL